MATPVWSSFIIAKGKIGGTYSNGTGYPWTAWVKCHTKTTKAAKARMWPNAMK
jgi:hypothetical protein